MEGNRDEALRCLEIAKNALAQGDKNKAKKFIFKADKLFPTPQAKGKRKTLFSLLLPPGSGLVVSSSFVELQICWIE